MTAITAREPALSIRAEGWGWRHAGRRTPALADVTLTINPGERVLIAGPSGSGKSTFLSACAGLLDAHAGVASGHLVVGAGERGPGRVPAGLLVQDPSTQILMSRIADDIAFGPENLAVAREDITHRVRDALADVGLDLAWDHSTSALSGGQTQRLALAGLLAMRPGLLLLDEPTASLDPAATRTALAQIETLVHTSGCTLVMVEHRIDLVLAQTTLVDRIILLDGARGVVADGSPEHVLGSSESTVDALGLWRPGQRPVRRERAARVSGAVLLTAEQVHVRHPGAASAAVQDASLVVPEGAVCAVVGPNGSGKTTLALAAAGLLPRVRGRVEVSDLLARGIARDPCQWRPEHRVPRIGVVFQNPEHQFVAQHVREEIAVGPTLLGMSPAQIRDRVDEVMTRLQLAHLAEANPFTLSGGEQRRLSVATALAAGAPLLVLDEPTFGQDQRTWIELVDLIAELRDAGSTILMVTHDEPLIAVLADQVVRMEGGRVLS